MNSGPNENRCAVDHAQSDPKDLAAQAQMRKVARTLLVLSGKGGVGKSTVAVNLAVALAKAGKKVGLLDIDVHGPSIPKMLHLEDRKAQIQDQQITPIRTENDLLVMSIGFLQPRLDEPVIWRGPMKHGVIRKFLANVNWGRLDYLIVDAPPGTGDEPLSIAQLAGPDSGAIIVTTPQQVAISDVRRCIAFCRTLSTRIVGIVENMSGWVCPHCGQKTDLLTAGGGKALAEELGLSLLGQIPIDPQVATFGDAGMPFVHDAAAPAAQAFAPVVRGILALDEGPDDTTEQDNERKETPRMKIAIPLESGRLCMHFGHCEQFALVETDEQDNIVDKTLVTPPPHEPGVLPAWLSEQGADVIIAGGMGQRAQELFGKNDITVVVGAPSETPEEVVGAYLAGTLDTGENVCDH